MSGVGPELSRLIQLFSKLPGLGPRSARRIVLHLLKKKNEFVGTLSRALDDVNAKVMICSLCGNVDTVLPCSICSDLRRDIYTLVVVETISDLWALERASAVRGRYHVLGGTLSPLDGIGPDELNLNTLVERVKNSSFSEIILAVNATLNGQTTAHYITELLAEFDVKITQLAHGVPMGGELDYLDEGTLLTAMKSRSIF